MVETQLAVGAQRERVICKHLAAVAPTHSSIPQKCACFSESPSSLTNRATSGSCSVGPIGPQMPKGLSAVACRQASMYSSASAAKILERVVHGHTKTGARKLLEIGRRARPRRE